MSVPRVSIRKQDGNTGVVRPGNEGILAIVAASADGDYDVPSSHNDVSLAQAEFSWGPLTDLAATVMPETQKGTVLVRANVSTPGAYSAMVLTGTGSSTPTAGASEPYDDFDVSVLFPTGTAVVGDAGATYRVSLDGGKTYGKVTALDTDSEIEIDNTGITIELGAGTLVAGDVITFTTSRPLATNSDLPASLEALRATSSPFEAVLVDMEADAETVGLIALWLLDLNVAGKFPVVFLTVRPMAEDETETEYKDALALMLAEAACTDVVLCADAADMVSTFRGISQARPTGLPVAARSMAVDIGTEPAYVALGPLTSVRISDARGNPRHHNEDKYPGLDDLRLTTLRTIEGFEGVYITNTNLLSASGSDFVYLPHARVMNRAASIAWQTLTKQLSRGVTKDPKAGPNGERYIADSAAKLIESLVQDAIDPAVKGKVDDLRFRLSRTDDISSNGGATITCFLESVALSYVKQFNVTARYVKQIASAAQ